MSNTDKSFADRLGRGRSMQSVIAGFTPVFEPADASLAPATFDSYLDDVAEANEDVIQAEADSEDAIPARLSAAEDVLAKALKVKDYVGSNVAWKKYHKTIERAANAVRGVYKLPKAPVVPEGSTPPPAGASPKGSRAQQGFADIAKNFGKLTAAVSKITGFTTPVGSGLSVVEQETQLAAYELLNKAVTDTGAALVEAQRLRKDAYDGEGGLREKMLSIKKATRSQYGPKSNQYAAVKSIKP